MKCSVSKPDVSILNRTKTQRIPQNLDVISQRESSAHREPEPSAKPAADSSSTPADTAARSCPPVTLCGAETLPEVNYLLQEWMTSMKGARNVLLFIPFVVCCAEMACISRLSTIPVFSPKKCRHHDICAVYL